LKKKKKLILRSIKLFVSVLIVFIGLQVPMLAEPTPPETSTLSGFVYDDESGETLIGAVVAVREVKKGNVTNKNGFYVISGIPSGEYEVDVTFVGYEKFTKVVKFVKGKSVRLDIRVKSQDIKTETIEVSAEREFEKREITISKINIDVDQIKEIRIGGESDVFRSLQYLPGILTSSQISSGLFIRGGSPDQNLVLLDGSVVYNPSHLFGFISTFNTDAIKDVELIKGGFQAEYGGRLSAVLNLTQNDGNLKEFGGAASIGAISSKAYINGPSPIEGGSYFLSGRRTYFELVKAFFPDDPADPLPDFSFWDINGKYTQRIGDDDKVTLSGFSSKDILEYSTYGLGFDLGIGNDLVAMHWNHVFSEKLFSEVNANYSNYSNLFNIDQNGNNFIVNNGIEDYTIKGTLEWFTNDRITHKFGFETVNYGFKYLQDFSGGTDSTGQSNNGVIDTVFNDWNHSAFAQINYRLTGQFSVQAGLRGSFWESADTNTWDPRLAFLFRVNDGLAIKGAWGIYHQNLRLASNPNFSFFDTWLPTDKSLEISRAIHYILSVETQPIDGYDFNVDIYYKSLNNVSELNRLVLSVENAADVFYSGDAESYGIEFFLQKRFGKFTGWVGYALGFIESTFKDINDGKPFRPKYDRRHDFKAVVQYQLNDDWLFGANFVFQSGQSYTGQTSQMFTTLDGSSIGRGITYPSQRYGLRLPPSHQLNLNASYLFKIGSFDSKFNIDIFNVYNRRDIWFRYYDTSGEVVEVKDILLLPILPTISIEVKF
jgi:carboxypeptidase-like protein/TonB-dependent receptor-like protein